MRLLLAMLAFLAGLFVDGYFQSADAQCGPNVKIYIDPRLVPSVSHYSKEDMVNIMRNPSIDPKMKETLWQMYMQQLNPIQMPYAGGRVLINPQNPCIQQFIPN